MLTTNFTGQPLSIADIAGISPILSGHASAIPPFTKRTLYVEITLKSGQVIVREAATQTYVGEYAPQDQVDEWILAYQKLEPEHAQLIADWKQYHTPAN